MNRSLFTRLAAIGLAASLGACNLFEEDNSGPASVSGTTSAWIGTPVDSLSAVGAFKLRDGRLFIAHVDSAAPGIAAIDTATGRVAEYYPMKLPPVGMAFTADGHLVVVATDYESGSVSVIDLSARRIRQDVIPFGSDPGVTAVDGRVYLIDHTSGAVTGFTGNTPGRNVAFDVQAGAGSNPYGIATAGGKAFIPRYNKSSLLVLGDANALGGGARDSIDLSAYAATSLPDSLEPAPRMASAIAHGGRVFVAVQRLNHQWTALDTALIVVIDAATNVIEKTIPLKFRNPVSAVVQGDNLYVTGIAGYGDTLGGVEVIDLASRTNGGVVVTEATLGADVFGFVPAGSNAGYVSYSTDYGFHTRLKKVSSTAIAKPAAR